MAAVLDWSMDLLEPEEVDLFERLAVFSGGFSLDDVGPVAHDGDGADVLPALGALVDQSLVLRVPAPDDQPRFRLLEPVRQFAMARLHASDQATATADRHAAHFHARASAFRDPLQGPGLAVALDRLEADHANLRSAYLRLLELDRDGDAAELAGSIWLYLALRGHAREGLAWLERIGPGASDVARCRALTGRLGLLMVTGDIEGMRRDTDEAVTLARRVADPGVTCEILILAGQGAVFAGALPEAERLLAGAAVAASESGRTWVAAHARLAQGLLALTAGDLATAGVVLSEAVATARDAGQPVHPGHRPQHQRHPHRAARRRAGDRHAARRGGRPVARRPAELDPRLLTARAGERRAAGGRPGIRGVAVRGGRLDLGGGCRRPHLPGVAGPVRPRARRHPGRPRRAGVHPRVGCRPRRERRRDPGPRRDGHDTRRRRTVGSAHARHRERTEVEQVPVERERHPAGIGRREGVSAETAAPHPR